MLLSHVERDAVADRARGVELRLESGHKFVLEGGVFSLGQIDLAQDVPIAVCTAHPGGLELQGPRVWLLHVRVVEQAQEELGVRLAQRLVGQCEARPAVVVRGAVQTQRRKYWAGCWRIDARQMLGPMLGIVAHKQPCGKEPSHILIGLRADECRFLELREREGSRLAADRLAYEPAARLE